MDDPEASDMSNDHHELDMEALGAVTGGGIVDKVLPESEATTEAFLKQFNESNLKIVNFINTPGSQPAAAPQEG